MIQQDAAERYIRNARRYLIGPWHKREQLVQLIKQSIEACDDDELELDYTGLVQTLGNPQTYVENLLCTLPFTKDMLHDAWKDRTRKRIAVLVALVASAAVVALVLLGSFYIKYQTALRNGYSVDITGVTAPAAMSDDDFSQFMDERFYIEFEKKVELDDLAEIKRLLGSQDLSILEELLEKYELSEIKDYLESQRKSEEGAGET